MSGYIRFLQFFERVVGINLRGGQGSVTQHLLDAVQVRPVVQQVGSQRMPEHVRRLLAGEPFQSTQLFPYRKLARAAALLSV